MLGCVAGLLCFSRLLGWLLSHVRHITLAFLTGLLIGSLNMVWPWKQTLTWRQNSQGESVPLVQENLWPVQYETLLGEPSYWQVGLALMLFAVVLVLALEWFGRQSDQ